MRKRYRFVLMIVDHEKRSAHSTGMHPGIVIGPFEPEAPFAALA